jgi:hypothetical protein
MFIHKVALLEVFILQILNHLKYYLLLQVLMLKEVDVAEELINLILVDLLQRDLHLPRYHLDDAVHTVRIVRVLVQIEGRKSLLLGEDKFTVDDNGAAHRFFC